MSETVIATSAAPNEAVVETKPANATNPELGKDGTPFDAERAQRTIERIQEENKALKAAQAELSQIKAQQAQAAEDALAEQGEFERLADDYKSKFTESSTELEKAAAERDAAFGLLTADIEKRVAALPDGVRKEVPSAKDATPLERLAKIAEIERYQAAFAPAKSSPSSPLRGAVAAGNHTEREKPQIPRPKLL